MIYDSNILNRNLNYRNKIILFLIMVFVYLDVPIILGNLIIPSIFSLLLFPYLFYNSKFYSNKIILKDYVAISALIFFSMFLSPGYEYLGEKFLSLFQSVIGLGLFFSIVYYNFDRKFYQKICGLFLIVLILGSVLELNLQFLKNFSDLFRSLVFPEAYLYQADIRDMTLVGHVRAKFFTSEPSYVVKFIYVCSVISYAFSRKNSMFIILSVVILFSFKIFGSPILIGNLISLIFMNLCFTQKRNNILIKSFLILFFLITLLLLSFYVESLNNFFQERFYGFGDSSLITSENVRMIFPFITAKDVLLTYPFYGVGVGGKELLPELSSITQFEHINQLVGENGFARIFIYYGIMGFVFIYLIFLIVKKALNNRNIMMCCFVLFVFMFVSGTIETIAFWSVLGIIIKGFSLSQEKFKMTNDNFGSTTANLKL